MTDFHNAPAWLGKAGNRICIGAHEAIETPSAAENPGNGAVLAGETRFGIYPDIA
ncbi:MULTISPECIES: hypothetical protein [Cupriavidus]